MNKLGDLLAAKGVSVAPPKPSAPATARPSTPAGTIDLGSAGKIVLRRERKGRGGKTVTVIEGLPAKALDPIARDLRKALGCGSTVEGATVVVQGDLADRAQAWLAARGATKIVLGTA